MNFEEKIKENEDITLQLKEKTEENENNYELL